MHRWKLECPWVKGDRAVDIVKSLSVSCESKLSNKAVSDAADTYSGAVHISGLAISSLVVTKYLPQVLLSSIRQHNIVHQRWTNQGDNCPSIQDLLLRHYSNNYIKDQFSLTSHMCIPLVYRTGVRVLYLYLCSFWPSFETQNTFINLIMREKTTGPDCMIPRFTGTITKDSDFVWVTVVWTSIGNFVNAPSIAPPTIVIKRMHS